LSFRIRGCLIGNSHAKTQRREGGRWNFPKPGVFAPLREKYICAGNVRIQTSNVLVSRKRASQYARAKLKKTVCGMKNFFPTAIALVCIVLVVSLIVLKRGGDAQHESDAGAIADFSNKLDSANLQIAACNGTLFIYSNSLDESRAASLSFSNQMVEAQSALALDAEQITNLNRRAAAAESENQILGRRVAELNGQMTNQVAALTRQITSTQARLDQADKDYTLLENRFRIDVAERVVAERKFNDLPALQAQILNLKENPFAVVTPGSIYAGLDVEVKTNGSFHVITPN